ncbi:MAG: hypothetical protein NTW07_09460, partial [candidate division Zixibacteria bacterium]|nr:hypothetical protein [candidate division Zixibacteria bacterium]
MKAITSRIWCVIFTLMVAGTVSTHKAVAQGQAPVALSVERFMLGGLHNTRKFDSVSVTQKLPSPGKALT